MSWTEIDGVPVVHVDDPGPLRAMLLFRVGKSDETLTLNGITHLVEHLALFTLGQQPHYQNGSVRTSVTSFETVGEPHEVMTFLAGVCASLSDLPVGRLEAEVRVLETEATRRPVTAVSALFAWRYGPAGPGLWPYDENATRTVTVDDLRAWVANAFTRDNAVLLLSGAPPDDLRLPLPRGRRIPVEPLRDVLPTTPSWFRHGFSDVIAVAPVRRSPAAVAYSYCLQAELVAALRFELGVAYSPQVTYDPYDVDTALLILSTDPHPEHVQKVAEVLSGLVRSLATEGPSDERFDEYIGMARRSLASAEAALGRAHSEALEMLMAGTVTPLEVHLAELDALTRDDIRDVAAVVRARLVYGLPADTELPDESVVAAPEWSLGSPVSGRRFAPVGAAWNDPTAMVTSPHGISLVRSDGNHATVMYATCRAMLTWPDGARRLYAADGISVVIEPTLWQDGQELVSAVDRGASAVMVPMPPRADEDIPTPSGPAGAVDGDRRPRRLGSLLLMGAGICLIVLGVVSGLETPGGGDLNRAVPIASGLSIFLWGLARD